MKTTILTVLSCTMLLLLACPNDPVVEVTEECELELLIEFPDTTSAAVSGCAIFEMAGSYEILANGPPDLRTAELMFDTSEHDTVECWMSINQEGICGTGYYDIAQPSSELVMATWDCDDVLTDNEAEVTFDTGWIQLTSIDTGDDTGDLSGIPVTNEIIGSLEAATTDGITIEGTFRMMTEVPVVGTEADDCFVLGSPP